MVLKNLFAGQQWRNRYREQIYGHGERGGEGEMYRESNIETDIKNRLMDTGRKEERVRCMERVTRKLTLPYVK